MALHFNLKVNDYSIGSFAAVRATDNGSDPESVNTYDVTIDDPDWEWDGRIEHRFGDEPWTLVRKAIEAMEADHAAATSGGDR